MVEITATLVKDLREKTQAGMMDCKKALQEANGDFEAAVKYLREKGLSAAAKRADRKASQGLIDIKFSEDNKTVAMVELNSETDFVAKNDKFKALLNQLLDQVLLNKPKDIAELENQEFIGDKTRKVSDMVTEAVAVIGENIIARRFEVFEITGVVESYIHMGGSIGVLVEFSGAVDKGLSKDIAMHIAASNPLYLDRTAVPAKDLENEKGIFRQQALNEGKPEAIVDRIAEGKISKFYQESCLVEQNFIKDAEKKIKDVLPAGVSILRFARFQLGV